MDEYYVLPAYPSVGDLGLVRLLELSTEWPIRGSLKTSCIKILTLKLSIISICIMQFIYDGHIGTFD